jgi:hypothetical protein
LETKEQTINHNKQEEYKTINEEGDPVIDQTKAKKHIADYFEDLYQARKGENSHGGWTGYINKTVQKHTRALQMYPSAILNTRQFNECIKKLKRNNSSGPDMMTNAAIVEADQQARKVILESLNETYITETIPTEWHKGDIIRIYKLNGTKWKCSNKRVITLSSNIVIIFIRLVDERIKHIINTNWRQTGKREITSPYI